MTQFGDSQTDLFYEAYYASLNAKPFLTETGQLKDQLDQVLLANGFPLLSNLASRYISHESSGSTRFSKVVLELFQQASGKVKEFYSQWWSVGVDTLRAKFPNASNIVVGEQKRPLSLFERVIREYMLKRYDDIYSREVDLVTVLNFKTPMSDLDHLCLIVLVITDRYIRYTKWLTVLYVNYMMGTLEQVPKEPLDHSLYPLWNRDFHKFLLRSKRNPVRINTFFMGFKRCLPPISPVEVLETLSKHHKCLSSVPDTWEEMEEKLPGVVEFVNLKERFNGKMMQLTRFWKQGNPSLFEIGTVSLNASSEMSRNRGGCLTQTIELLEDEGYLDAYYPLFDQCYVVRDNHHTGGHLDFSLTTEFCRSDETLFEAWRKYYIEKGSSVTGRTTVKSVLEPMKARVMTAGSPETNAFLSNYQKWLFKGLGSVYGDPFRLTADSSAVVPAVEWLNSVSSETYFNSGDYSQATDKLNARVSKEILQQLLLAVECPELASQVLKSMTDCDMVTNDRSLPVEESLCDDDGKPYTSPFKVNWQQSNGQLMGSIVSFPILCIANFIIYWLSREAYFNKEISLGDLMRFYPVLVNGDDILFKGSKDYIQYWMRFVAAFGFEPSLGKNFVSPTFFTINSKLFYLDPMEVDAKPKLIPYINFGLLTGRKKGSIRNLDDEVIKDNCDSSRLMTLGKVWKDLVEVSPSQVVCSNLWRLFVKYYGRLISPLVKDREKAIWDLVQNQCDTRNKVQSPTKILGTCSTTLYYRSKIETPELALCRQPGGDRVLKIVRDGLRFLDDNSFGEGVSGDSEISCKDMNSNLMRYPTFTFVPEEKLFKNIFEVVSVGATSILPYGLSVRQLDWCLTDLLSSGKFKEFENAWEWAIAPENKWVYLDWQQTQLSKTE
jgi:hypothetical protein